jgi:hypothetical protein
VGDVEVVVEETELAALGTGGAPSSPAAENEDNGRLLARPTLGLLLLRDACRVPPARSRPSLAPPLQHKALPAAARCFILFEDRVCGWWGEGAKI